MGKLLRLAREARGLRQLDLARRLRISSGTLSLIESGQQQPTAELARRIAAALGLEAGDLFPETEEVRHGN